MKSKIDYIANTLKEENQRHPMDMGDLGNIIGMQIQKAIDEGHGTMEDYLRGFKHGVSLIDGTHDEVCQYEEKQDTTLTLEIIQSFNMESQIYTPDHDDRGYLFTLPKSGFQLSTLTLCNNEPTESDSLEGLDGSLYITTKEELEVIITLDEKQLFEYIEADNPEFNREDHE